MTVAIVDCGGANLRSVQRAVEIHNMKAVITNAVFVSFPRSNHGK